MSPTSQFVKEDGTRVSYIDYYKQQHGLGIQTNDQPLLVSKPRRKGVRPTGQATANVERGSLFTDKSTLYLTGPLSL